MVYNVLLISEQKLIDNTAINGTNVDTSELRFAIMQAQTIFIQESLGTNLYNKVLQIVDNGTISSPSNNNYKVLLDSFIQPTLIQYAYYLALDNIFVKWSAVGLMQNRTEQGGSIDLKTLQYLKNNAKNNAEFNDNLLRRQLIWNNSLYPEYSLVQNNGELPPESNSPFKSSMTLPGAGWYYGMSGIGALGFNCDRPDWYGPVVKTSGNH
jgi:hypothetical protein